MEKTDARKLKPEVQQQMRNYSPAFILAELNPDEYLNCDLKDGIHSGVLAKTQFQLKKTAIFHLQ